MIPPNNNFTIHFDFDASVPESQLKDTMILATMAAETLFGPERVELECRTEHDIANHGVSIYSPTEVGRSLAVLFLGFCRREFGKGVKVQCGQGGAK